MQRRAADDRRGCGGVLVALSIRVVAVQDARVGRKTVKPRKCQDKWCEMYDHELQMLKREAGRVLALLKRQRNEGADVSDLYAKYREVRAAAKSRLKLVLKTRAVELVKKVELLKASDAKEGWRALKSLIGTSGVKSSSKFDTAFDAQGKERHREEAKKAVRDAYASLGIENLHDEHFDIEFARHTRLHVRRMAAERIQQDELDARFSLKELQAVLKLLNELPGVMIFWWNGSSLGQ